MEIVFRLPGSREYSYAEIKVEGASPIDVMRNMRELDTAFLTTAGNLLESACAAVALGPLQPQPVAETGPQWNDAASAPQWAQSAPQEAQQPYPVPSAPQGGYAPQNGSQGYTQHVPMQQYPSAQPQQTPPGQNAPICQRHGQPATYKPGGVSRTTNRPYDAFWACAANDRDCTKASNFPKA